jgi:hypothetical protein
MRICRTPTPVTMSLRKRAPLLRSSSTAVGRFRPPDAALPDGGNRRQERLRGQVLSHHRAAATRQQVPVDLWQRAVVNGSHRFSAASPRPSSHTRSSPGSGSFRTSSAHLLPRRPGAMIASAPGRENTCSGPGCRCGTLGRGLA